MSDIEIPKPTNQHVESSLTRSNLKIQDSKKELPNTTKTKPDKTGKIIKGNAKKKKLTFGEKLKRSFVKEDIQDVGDYIVFDVLIPGIKQSIFDVIIGAISQTLGIRPTMRYEKLTNGYNGNRQYRDYTSVQAVSDRRRIDNRPQYDRRYDRHRVSDVVFEYKEDATALLEQMMDICDTYGWFSVFDFYDKAGIVEGNDHTNLNFGWHSVDGASIRFDGTGYVIVLPQARMR